MDCCGQGRAAGRAGVPPVGRAGVARAGSRPAAGAVAAYGGPAMLRWRRRVSAQVRGPASGRTYAVSAARPVVVVDAADAAGLLATGFFDRAG